MGIKGFKGVKCYLTYQIGPANPKNTRPNTKACLKTTCEEPHTGK